MLQPRRPFNYTLEIWWEVLPDLLKNFLRFKKIELKPESKEVIEFTFSAKDLSFYGPDKKWITEAGDFKFWIAKHAQDESNELNVSIIE